VFRWKAGPSTLTSTLQIVDPPGEIAWTGTTMGIKAVHVFRFQAAGGGTLARSEESWEGLLASLLKSYSRKTLNKEIRGVLAHLKAEAERRAATAEHPPRVNLPCAHGVNSSLWGQYVHRRHPQGGGGRVHPGHAGPGA
jgi:hypothetical protein